MLSRLANVRYRFLRLNSLVAMSGLVTPEPVILCSGIARLLLARSVASSSLIVLLPQLLKEATDLAPEVARAKVLVLRTMGSWGRGLESLHP